MTSITSSSSEDSGSASRSEFISIQEVPPKEDSSCRKESFVGAIDSHTAGSSSPSDAFSCLKLGDEFAKIIGARSCDTPQMPTSGADEERGQQPLQDTKGQREETKSVGVKVNKEQPTLSSPWGEEYPEKESFVGVKIPLCSEEDILGRESQSLPDSSNPLSSGISQSSVVDLKKRFVVTDPSPIVNEDRFIDAEESFPQVPIRLVGDRSGNTFSSSSRKKGIFVPLLKKEQAALDVSFLGGHKTTSLRSAASRPYSGHLSNHRPSQAENNVAKRCSFDQSSNEGNHRAESLEFGVTNSESFSLGGNMGGASDTRINRQAVTKAVCRRTVQRNDGNEGANKQGSTAGVKSNGRRGTETHNSRRKLENIFDETIDIADLDLELPDYVFHLDQSKRKSAYSETAQGGPARFAHKHFKGKKNQMMSWIHSRISGKNLNEWRRKVSGPQRRD